MTVPNSVARVRLTYPGDTNPLALANAQGPLYFQSGSTLVVTLVRASDGGSQSLAVGTDYTITGDGTQGAASLQPSRALPAGVITVRRSTAAIQQASWANTDGNPSGRFETTSDYGRLIDAENVEALSRTFQLADTAAPANTTIDPAAFDGRYMTFEDGAPTPSSKTVGEIEGNVIGVATSVPSIAAVRALPASNANLGEVVAVTAGDGTDGIFVRTSVSGGADNTGTRLNSATPNFYYNRLTGGADLNLGWFRVQLLDEDNADLAAANDAAIALWVGELGNSKKRGAFMSGVEPLVYGTDIVIPANAYAYGSLNGTVLKPRNTITSCGITQGAGSTLESLTLDGSYTTGKRGWEIGVNVVASSDYPKVNNGLTKRLQVQNFAGAGGAGGWIPRADAWRCQDNLWWGGNNVGFIVGPQSLDIAWQEWVPTELTFDNEYYKQNAHQNLLIYGGSLCRWKEGSSEEAGDEGILCTDTYMNAANPMDDMLFEWMHIEQNQQNYLAASPTNDARDVYNVVVNISANDGRASGWRMKDCRFVSQNNRLYARPFHGKNCRDTKIEDPGYYVLTPGHATAFKIDGSGDSAVFQWSLSKCGDPCDMIEDNTNGLGAVQVAGYTRDIDVSPAMGIVAAAGATFANVSFDVSIQRRGRLVFVAGQVVFTPTWTGTPGAFFLRCSDINFRAASDRATAHRSSGPATVAQYNAAGFSGVKAFVDPNGNKIAFLLEGNNIAPRNLNIQDLPSGSVCAISFSVEYEAKFVGTLG